MEETEIKVFGVFLRSIRSTHNRYRFLLGRETAWPAWMKTEDEEALLLDVAMSTLTNVRSEQTRPKYPAESQLISSSQKVY